MGRLRSIVRWLHDHGLLYITLAVLAGLLVYFVGRWQGHAAEAQHQAVAATEAAQEEVKHDTQRNLEAATALVDRGDSGTAKRTLLDSARRLEALATAKH